MSSPTTEEFFFLSPLLLLFGSQEELGINLTLTKILAQLLREAFACLLPGTAPALVSPIPVQKEAEVHGWTQNFCSRWTFLLPATLSTSWQLPAREARALAPTQTHCRGVSRSHHVSAMEGLSHGLHGTGGLGRNTACIFHTRSWPCLYFFPFLFLFCWSAELKEGESFLALLWAVTASGERLAGGEAR